MILKRDLTSTLKRFSKFPVVVLLGPRQSGKTTLVKEVFKKYAYFSLEDPAVLDFVLTDARRFLRENENEHGIIIDEFQHAPKLLSYIQLEVDARDRPGYFVLTGSQNFLMNQAITQSLAGRAGVLNLLPLSIHELEHNALLPENANTLMFKGGYPRIHAKDFAPRELFPSYIRTYVERDVRQLINVTDLSVFQKFMMLCAGRIGQQLNFEDIAANCGINRKTAQKWLSLLEASYIIFLLRPHFNNFNKRITKSPKLYFFDTGLACSFLGIRSAEELALSPFRGALFECLIISDFYKQYYNQGFEAPLYYWRDQNGRLEVDCIIDRAGTLFPIEIKSGETIVSDYFNAIKAWSELANADPADGYIVYAGDISQHRSAGFVKNWKSSGHLIHDIEKSK